MTALCAAAAATATCSVTAHAFDRTESLDPVPAGRGYVYYVKELDTDHQPIPGHVVTMSVQQGAGADASVAPCDPKGHPTGPAGQTASELSGADGLAYFLIKTSTTPGTNEFTWKDDTYHGQVVVVGRPLPGAAGATARRATGASHAATAAAAAAAAARAAAAHAKPPQGAMPPLAAGLLAFLLVWLVAPPLLARRVQTLALPSLPAPPRSAQALRP